MPSPSSRRGLLAQRVLDLIGDEWISADELLEKAIPLVPPGKALRNYRVAVERNAADRLARIEAGHKPGPTRPTPPEHEQIRRGARAIVNHVLGAARENRTILIEARENRHDRWFRLNPERRWSHHCCLHGGSCAANPTPADDEEEVGVATPEERATPEPGELLLPTGDWGTLTEWLEAQGIAHRVTASEESEALTGIRTGAGTAEPIRQLPTNLTVPRFPYPEYTYPEDRED